MKKLLALIGLALTFTVTAQEVKNPGYFWTNGVSVYTNIQMGATFVPLTTNQWQGLVWAANRWNTQYGLTTTNRYTVRDAAAQAISHTAGQWGAEYLAEQEAKASLIAIRKALVEATDAQINQIKTLLGIQ